MKKKKTTCNLKLKVKKKMKIKNHHRVEIEDFPEFIIQLCNIPNVVLKLWMPSA